MSGRTSWADIKSRRRKQPDVRSGYLAARANYRLAERVRALRESRGVSQQELADMLGTTQSVISRLEAGGTKPTLTTLERVGEALRAELVIEFTDVVGAQTAASIRPISIIAGRPIRARSRALRYAKKALKTTKNRR